MGLTNENVRGAFRISRVLSLSLVIKYRNTERTKMNTNLKKPEKQRLQNNVRANFSVYQRMPNFLKIFLYAGPIRYSVTGP